MPKLPFETVPPSREVRIKEGAPVGDLERIAFGIYTGDAGELGASLVKLELVMESRESKALDALSVILKQKLVKDGYIVISDVDEGVRQWHEDDILGIDH